jgi:AMMECR1 domain-containing protein
MTKAAADVRFKGPLTRKELLRSTMEIWIQTAATELPAKQRKQRSAFTLGLHGAEVARDGRSAYYKPSVSLTSGFHTVTSMLRRLCKKAGLPRDA